MKKITKMLRGGVILLSMMLPLCMWAATDYSKYTHVPGNNIPLNPSVNNTTSHSGCKYESGHDNVGYIKDGCYSTYHISVDQPGNYELSMGIRRSKAGTFTLTITDEATGKKELEQTFDIPKPAKEYAECLFTLEKSLTTGYKTVKMLYNYSDAGAYIMNYNNLTFKALNPVLAKWDFSNSTDGYVQKDGTSSPFLAFYPGEYAYGDNTMFTLSTGGVKGGGLDQAILNTNKDLELREGSSPSGFISEAAMTDGSKHYLYYEISVPTIGFESVTLTAMVSHNQSNHNMYAVYSVDGGETWTGTQKVALNNGAYVPVSITLPGGKDNVLVRLHPDNNWYYYLQSCTLSGEMVKSYKVKTNAKGWASFSAVQPVGLPAGLKAYAATDINNDYVMLKELTNVAAEEGVFVKGAANTEYTLDVVDDEVTKEATNLIKPILLASAGHTVENTETIYALATKAEKCGLYRVQPGVTVKGKAYLDATGKSITKAPMFYELGDGAATGIVEVRAATVQNQTNTCYNVLGQRVAKNVKGIVLVNGKKMLNK